jgi:hypothetical protein
LTTSTTAGAVGAQGVIVFAYFTVPPNFNFFTFFNGT